MELNIKEVHTYNDLVNSGRAEKLKLPGVDDDAIVVPRIDDLDKVYFYDVVSESKIYPGISTIEKIKKTIDKELKS